MDPFIHTLTHPCTCPRAGLRVQTSLAVMEGIPSHPPHLWVFPPFISCNGDVRASPLDPICPKDGQVSLPLSGWRCLSATASGSSFVTCRLHILPGCPALGSPHNFVTHYTATHIQHIYPHNISV